MSASHAHTHTHTHTHTHADTHKQYTNLFHMLRLRRCLTEAAGFAKPRALRQLFVVILLLSQPQNPKQLWLQHMEALCQDKQYHLHGTDGPPSVEAQRLTLLDIDYLLQMSGADKATTVKDKLGIDIPPPPPPSPQAPGAPQPPPPPPPPPLIEQREIHDYDPVHLAETWRQGHSTLYSDQLHAYERIMAAVDAYTDRQQPALPWFLHAEAGGGKTHLINIILAAVRLRRRAALATASTGIAAQLMTGGLTTHSTFRLGLEPEPDMASQLPKHGAMAHLLQQHVSLIVVDEVTCLHRHIVEQLDRTLRDVLNQPDRLFGGMPVLLCGDFGQTLPVVPHGSRAQQEAAALCASPIIWPHLQHLRLTQNMRVCKLLNTAPERAAELQQWVDQLRRLRCAADGDAFVVPQGAHALCHCLCQPAHATHMTPCRTQLTAIPRVQHLHGAQLLCVHDASVSLLLRIHRHALGSAH